MTDKRNNKPALSESMVNSHGKIPPQACDLEEAVLGALMLERDSIFEITSVIKTEAVFYKEAHQKIYTSIMSLFAKGEPIDILTVTNELKKAGELDAVGGAYYITQLTNRVASAANIESHARIILQKHIQRELIRIASETIKAAFEDTTDVLYLLEYTQTSFLALNDGIETRRTKNIKESMDEAIQEIQLASESKNGITGVPSGWRDVDKMTGGFKPGQLIVVAARPGMGKTALVVELAKKIALRYQKKTAIFSLEMTTVELCKRIISSETSITNKKLDKGELNQLSIEALKEKVSKISNGNCLFLDDEPGMSITQFRAKVLKLMMTEEIDLIIIDYLQLMDGDSTKKGQNREGEISDITRNLKKIAKEVGVPIIALSQLNRAVESRGGDKRPQLSDLRESGAIEQDADMVIFIYRPEYYGITEYKDGSPTEGMAELIWAKHRGGPVGTETLKYVQQFNQFSDLSFYEEPPIENKSGDPADDLPF